MYKIIAIIKEPDKYITFRGEEMQVSKGTDRVEFEVPSLGDLFTNVIRPHQFTEIKINLVS